MNLQQLQTPPTEIDVAEAMHDADPIVAVVIRRLAYDRNRLQAIVDRLPKTADGVPVTPSMELWWVDGASGISAYGRESMPTIHHYIEDTYSTREAAEAARAKADE